IQQLATECFMPVTYGGGVTSIKSFQRVIGCGIEKVALNTAAILHPRLITEAAEMFGSSSVVAAIDVKKDFFKIPKVFSHIKRKMLAIHPVHQAMEMEKNGAGEILLQSTERDGMMSGYDLSLIGQVASSVSIPVIACGGAGTLEHFAEALKAGASAAAAGSKFVFRGKHHAVLINYFSSSEINQLTGRD
ncbi:MAG: HisA/HisF-related TIM barrel protein, partial [Chitinophagales bacterium]